MRADRVVIACVVAAAAVAGGADEACGGRTRTGLILMAQHFRGSTAMMGALMSSPQLATTCGARKWQCEEGRIEGADGRHINRVPPDAQLAAMAPHLDLRRRVLLLAKLGGSFLMERDVALALRLANASAPLPGAYGAAGVDAIAPVALMVYWPPCLRHNLSSHFARDANRSAAAADDADFAFLEGLARSRRRLAAAGVPSVVASFGDVLWRPRAVAAALEARVPCLGAVDFAFEPRLGIDVFPENEWKAGRSVAAFAAGLDPAACCSYDAALAACAPDYWTSHAPRGRIPKDRAFAALRLLRKFAADDEGDAAA